MGDAKRTKYNPYKDHFKQQPVVETQPEEKEKSLDEYLGTHNEQDRQPSHDSSEERDEAPMNININHSG